jgi:hypothetical protein
MNALASDQETLRPPPSPPFPPDSFVEALRFKFRDAIRKLREMGRKPFKKAAGHVLVNQINGLNAAHGQVVETEEREDLCAALGELAFLARHPALMEDVDDWRTW